MDRELKIVAVVIFIVLGAAVLITSLLLGLSEALSRYTHGGSVCQSLVQFIDVFWAWTSPVLGLVLAIVMMFLTMRFFYYSPLGGKLVNMDNSIHSNLEGNAFSPDDIDAANMIDHNVKSEVFGKIIFVVFVFYLWLFYFVLGGYVNRFVESFLDFFMVSVCGYGG